LAVEELGRPGLLAAVRLGHAAVQQQRQPALLARQRPIVEERAPQLEDADIAAALPQIRLQDVHQARHDERTAQDGLVLGERVQERNAGAGQRDGRRSRTNA